MQIGVNDVDAHVAGARDADVGVEIRAVAVEIRALCVEDVRHFADVGFEETEGVGDGDHQRGHVFVDGCFEYSEIDGAAVVRFQFLDLIAGECCRRGIGPVRGVGDEDVLARVAALRERLVHHQDAGQLAMCAGHRLQRHARHAEDFLQRLLERPQQLEIPLHLMLRLERMRLRESPRARDLFVDARVVFHRAGAEGIQALIDREVELRQACEVADDVDFRDFDFFRDLAAHERLRQHVALLRHVERRQLITAPSRFRALEDQRLSQLLRSLALGDFRLDGRHNEIRKQKSESRRERMSPALSFCFLISAFCFSFHLRSLASAALSADA